MKLISRHAKSTECTKQDASIYSNDSQFKKDSTRASSRDLAVLLGRRGIPQRKEQHSGSACGLMLQQCGVSCSPEKNLAGSS